MQTRVYPNSQSQTYWMNIYEINVILKNKHSIKTLLDNDIVRLLEYTKRRRNLDEHNGHSRLLKQRMDSFNCKNIKKKLELPFNKKGSSKKHNVKLREGRASRRGMYLF